MTATETLLTAVETAPAPVKPKRARKPAKAKAARKPRKPKADPAPVQPRQAGIVETIIPRLRGLPWFAILVIAVLAFLVARPYLPGGSPAPLADVVMPVPAPAPTPTPVIPAAEMWESVARWVEMRQIDSTDELVKNCRQMQKSGYLTDLSRIDVYAQAKSKPIDDSNRAEVLRVLRGG